MSLSIQTNVNSLVAQQNMNVNNAFQSKTIQQLTSGYRINQSGDDAAGLAVANKFRSSVAELTQGVANGNDGVAQLQIMDGGMSNISQILDRLKTLATQSASGAFTGNRATLNSEFQTDLQEINRQAQSIGLNTGGTFAKSLSVYLGAGSGSAGVTGSASAALVNSAVSVDLSKSTVDSQSLGLQGMQAAGTTDIGPGAGSHSVANVVAATSGNAQATSGDALFYFMGGGFSGSSKIAVSVNLASVSDVSTLANAINTAISAAANNPTQAASYFKAANVVASVHTDSSGGQELAFTSGTAAFQVQAGDQMANALLGNFQSSTSSTGTAIAATVSGAATTAGTAFTPSGAGAVVRISGASMSAPVNLTLGSDATVGAVVTDLQTQIAANSALTSAGISVALTGGKVTFTSSSGEQIGVQVSGDTTNALGYGTFQTTTVSAAAALDYTDIVAPANYVPTAAGSTGTATLQLSVNGGATTTASVDLSQGATAGTWTSAAGAGGDAHGKSFSIDGVDMTAAFSGAGVNTLAAAATAINGTAVDVRATIDTSGHLVLTKTSAGPGTISITGTDAAAVTTALFNGASVVAGQGSSLANVVEQLNNDFSTSAAQTAAGLKAVVNGSAVEITSQNGTYFRVGSTGAHDIGFGVSGGTMAGITVGGAANTTTDAGGVSYFANVNGGSNTTGFTFSGLANGNDSQAITLSANNATTGALQSMTITLQNHGANRQGADIDSAINYINQQLQLSNNPTLQSIVAVKENNGGTQKINFISSLASFSVGIASTANANGVNGGAANTYAAGMNGSASNMAIDTQAGALQAISAITAAVGSLGSAQAAVGKGENQLNYAINLAQSQITNFSSAESQIRDANIAQQAANLTKAQVLQQAAIAAMAQANSAPQAVLKLLQT